MKRIPKTVLLSMLLPTFAAVASAEGLSVLTASPEGTPPGKQLEVYPKQEFYLHGEGMKLDGRRPGGDFQASLKGAGSRLSARSSQ